MNGGSIPSIHTLFALCETARLVASSELGCALDKFAKETPTPTVASASSSSPSSLTAASPLALSLSLPLTHPVKLASHPPRNIRSAHDKTSTTITTTTTTHTLPLSHTHPHTDPSFSSHNSSEDDWRFPPHALHPHNASSAGSNASLQDTRHHYAQAHGGARVVVKAEDTPQSSELALDLDEDEDGQEANEVDDAIDPESRRIREMVFQQPLQFGLPINRRNPTIGHIVAQYVSQLERRNSYWDKKSTCVKRRKRTVMHSVDEIESRIRTGKKCKARVPVTATPSSSS